MPHFAIPPVGTPAFDEWLAKSLTAPRPQLAKAIRPPRKSVVRPEPDLSEPVRRPGECWVAFSRRWDASPLGRAARAKADALNATVGVENRAETLRDARQDDARTNRVRRIIPEQI